MVKAARLGTTLLTGAIGSVVANEPWLSDLDYPIWQLEGALSKRCWHRAATEGNAGP